MPERYEIQAEYGSASFAMFALQTAPKKKSSHLCWEPCLKKAQPSIWNKHSFRLF